ncbi:MAG TPA: glucokinase [Rhodocyclaceae bacterium]|nr:glucokinase [Rhodocyclaceae bacterium]
MVGDIGGTNARLALAISASGRLTGERTYACADVGGFEPILADFLAKANAKVAGGCLAVAGPIADDGRSARLTNLPWAIDADALAARHGLGRLILANDFTAAALGVTACAPASLIALQAGEPLADAPCLVVGAGTGLGMAVLLPDRGRWRVLPGEGGHVAFAPADALQADLWRQLSRRQGRVTWESVVSGPGLEAIYRFLAPMASPASAAEIAALAAADPPSFARQAVNLFLAAYGAFAGDMALAVLARGGVFLAGGIAARLADQLPASLFLQAFNAKAEHAGLAARMPVSVATDPVLGLRGAAMLCKYC